MNFETLVLHRGAADWGLPMTHIITRQDANDPFDRRHTIAEIPSIQPYCMGASPADIAYADTQLAYATLFAAAPDLLAALEEARNGLIAWVDGSVPDTMARIDAALAKAYGKEPAA